MPEPVFTDVVQVALVVRDLDAKLRTYWDEYGIGPWEIYEFNSTVVGEMVRNEAPAEYAMRLAVARLGHMVIELIQPLDDRTIYAEFLERHGEGIQHLGLVTSDYRTALDALRAKGHKVVQGGKFHDRISFAYLSTDRDLGFVSEIFDFPPDFPHPMPDAVYPPGAEPNVMPR